MDNSTLRYRAVPVKQNEEDLYIFAAPAADLYEILDINERDSDKDQGYQRALSLSRVRSVSDFVNAKHEIAPAIVVSLRDTTFDKDTGELVIPKQPSSGWVIDGQHRLVGATKATITIELAVVAFLNLDIERQIFQFVTINRTAKGVPTSLYYDLLKHLPPSKKPAEIAKDKAADIAHELRRDEKSPLFNRITIASPKPGHTLSLTNFVRKVAPLIQKDPARSPISHFYVQEQAKIFDNYFHGLRGHAPQFFRHSPSIIFRTLGFGALLNAFPTIFSLTLRYHQAFRVEDVVTVFNKIDFDFSEWEKSGSGNAAELQAGKDLEEAARYPYDTDSSSETSMLRL